MSVLGHLIRQVVRAKLDATGLEWRRLHRVESILQLAAGRIRSMAKRIRRRRKSGDKGQEAPK